MNFKFCLLLGLLSPALSRGEEAAGVAAEEKGFVPLFSQEGIPSEWMVRRWDDIAKPAERAAVWKNQNGILQGSEPRGTWLMSQKLKDRHRRGHIGFQELSRGGGHVEIRNARIKVLD